MHVAEEEKQQIIAELDETRFVEKDDSSSSDYESDTRFFIEKF